MIGDVPRKGENEIPEPIPPEGNLPPESEETAVESESKAPQAGSKQEGAQVAEAESQFDYEAEKAKIEERSQERINKLGEIVEQAFHGNYVGSLETAEGKIALRSDGGEVDFSNEEKLALAIDKKDKEIREEKRQELLNLDIKKAYFEREKAKRTIEEIDKI